MSHIPVDVLCECFAHLHFADRVAATHVCTHWRQAALSHPGALWSCVISNGTSTGVVRQLFERAQSVPVKVAILLTDETFADAMAAVSDHLFHIRTLSLTSLERREGGLCISNIHPVYRALACPAPMLEELEIALPIDDRSAGRFDLHDEDTVLSFDRRIPTDLFAGHAPRLWKAAFLTMQLHPEGVPALAGLTRLRYTASQTLPAAQLSAIGSSLPNLKALCIEAQYGAQLPHTPLHDTFCLDELDLVSLEDFRIDAGLGGLLRYLKHHLIRDLTMDRVEDVGWLDARVDPPRSIPHTLHLYETQFGFCDWEMADAGGYTSRGRSFRKETLFSALASRNVFARVQTLVLSVTLFSSDIPPLDQLTHLFLYCPFSIMPHVPIPGPRESNCNVPCPRLRVLEICGEKLPPRVGKLTVRADDLERFLENLFSSSQHRRFPPRVVLRNVALYGPELLQDQSMLGTLSYSDEPLELPGALQTNGQYRRWHVFIEELFR